jgi:hypothetical protein
LQPFRCPLLDRGTERKGRDLKEGRTDGLEGKKNGRENTRGGPGGKEGREGREGREETKATAQNKNKTNRWVGKKSVCAHRVVVRLPPPSRSHC